MPVVPPLPVRSAVYAPGVRVTTMAASRSSPGCRPVASMAVRWVSFQLSFDWRRAPLELRSSRTGSARKSVIPKPPRTGPIPRMITFLGVSPVMMKPAIMIRSPVPTPSRLERLTGWAGVAVGVADGIAVAVAVAVAVGATVAVAVAVGATVAVAVAVGATVAVAVAVGA